MCCNPWGCKESDMTEWLNWTELNWMIRQSIALEPVKQSQSWYMLTRKSLYFSVPGSSSIQSKYVELMISKVYLRYYVWSLKDSKKISLQKDNTFTQKFKNRSHIKECVHWKALLPSLFLCIPSTALSGVGKLSVKAQVINILGLQAVWTLLQWFNSAIAVQKQP